MVKRKSLKQLANQNDLELPTDFEIDGFKAKGLSESMVKRLFYDDSYPYLDPDADYPFKCLNGSIRGIIVSDECRGNIYNIYDEAYDYADNWGWAVKVSIHEFNKKLSPFEIIIENAIYPEDIDDAHWKN